MRFLMVVVLAAFFMLPTYADGPKDNDPRTIRVIPPVGLDLSDQVESSLRERCQQIRQRWNDVVARYEQRTETNNRYQKARFEAELRQLTGLEPEILVFPRAVELALEFRQFYKEAEIDSANELLDLAAERIERAESSVQWATVVALGDGSSQQLLVGGYRSKIDASFQPYAIVIPPGFSPDDARPRRLDLWFHGRGETLSEVNFLKKGLTNAGQYTPKDSFVLHPFGRYSNAFKFAGEIDVLEAFDYIRERLPVDPTRVSARGFSMGGAACWQFATHYADRFFAANPGAGFSETPEFLKSFQGEDLSETPAHQRTLWKLYDCPPWSRNLLHCPTVAYSGEIDRQKQAADVMEAILKDHDIDLLHIIGPDTAHKIHEESKVEIESRMDALARAATAAPPTIVDLTTFTLRYHRMHWLEIHGLAQHWQRGHVKAELQLDSRGQEHIKISPTGVTRIRLRFDSGQWNRSFPCRPLVTIGQNQLVGPPIRSDRSWIMDLEWVDDAWRIASETGNKLAKRPGLQGPIDDAFMDAFLFVTPSGSSSDPERQQWIEAEMQHAMEHWRKHFRGDVRAVKDTELTESDIADNHLVLFGDADSNQVIREILGDLPITWDAERIHVGSRQFASDNKVISMIYPNPTNPDRYVVLNSGFTFREYDYLNNARQTPKLPDWAVIDITDGATGRDPGKIEAAGFFDEQWLPR